MTNRKAWLAVLSRNFVSMGDLQPEVTDAPPGELAQLVKLGYRSFGVNATFGADTSASPTGRLVTSTAVTDGTITTSGTAAWWAATDEVNSRLMAHGSLSATQVVSAVGVFTAAGYVGWVAGAPIVGWVSQTFGPARGLQVLALASFGVAGCTLLSTERTVPDETTR